MRILLIALLLLSFAVPAFARGGGKRSSDPSQQSSAETQKRSRAEEKAYKAVLKNIPDQKPADPWGKMR
jgi:hypothetical protein